MKKSDFQIRLAKDLDLSIIEQIWVSGLRQYYSDIEVGFESLKLFRSNFQNRNNVFNFWVAETSSVVGWCSILPAFSHPLKKNSYAEISTYILQSMTQRGVGTNLMKFVFDELIGSEIESVFGFANPKNINSIKMCKNAGMKICGQTSTKIILIKEY